MEIDQFALERWFGEHEHEADLMLAESGVRSLPADRFDTDPGALDYVIPTDGDPAFRTQVAERYGRSAEELVFTCGTQEANFLTFLATMGAGSVSPSGEAGTDPGHAVVVTPTYQALHAVPEAVGTVDRVPLSTGDWRLDPDDVRAAVTDETDLVVVNNPNNPTGRYHPEATIRELYDVAAEHDAYLLCDEVYRKLAADPLPPVASMGAHGISTTSVTKAYGLAGLRFGWIAGAEPVVERAVRWKDYTTISPSLFGQHVARQALGDEEEPILAENRELADRNRELVAAFVDEYDLDWLEPVGVNAFFTVPEGFADAREFCTAVVEEESAVLAPGDCFGYPGYVRLGFGLATEELEEGLARVASVIERRA